MCVACSALLPCCSQLCSPAATVWLCHLPCHQFCHATVPCCCLWRPFSDPATPLLPHSPISRCIRSRGSPCPYQSTTPLSSAMPSLSAGYAFGDQVTSLSLPSQSTMVLRVVSLYPAGSQNACPPLLPLCCPSACPHPPTSLSPPGPPCMWLPACLPVGTDPILVCPTAGLARSHPSCLARATGLTLVGTDSTSWKREFVSLASAPTASRLLV